VYVSLMATKTVLAETLSVGDVVIVPDQAHGVEIPMTVAWMKLTDHYVYISSETATTKSWARGSSVVVQTKERVLSPRESMAEYQRENPAHRGDMFVSAAKIIGGVLLFMAMGLALPMGCEIFYRD
jgi:hypothetical protein